MKQAGVRKDLLEIHKGPAKPSVRSQVDYLLVRNKLHH